MNIKFEVWKHCTEDSYTIFGRKKHVYHLFNPHPELNGLLCYFIIMPVHLKMYESDLKDVLLFSKFEFYNHTSGELLIKEYGDRIVSL